jgi:hypothetical protein
MSSVMTWTGSSQTAHFLANRVSPVSMPSPSSRPRSSGPATPGKERRYFLSSIPIDTRLFAKAVQSHWHIENRLHWVLDVVLHEDLRRLRSGTGPQNMANIRHIPMSLIRDTKENTVSKSDENPPHVTPPTSKP